MKIKSKLTLGIGLLVTLIVLLVLLSTLKVRTLATDTKNILTANYNTLEYSRYMLKALDEIAGDKDAWDKFNINLSRQKNNITEIGEAELTDNLEVHFKQYQNNKTDAILPRTLRNDIDAIMKINMDAIERKSRFANNTAEETIHWITITGALCFLIAFTMLLNLPGSIANPIKELTGSITEIAGENYTSRVHFESHDEFGDLAASFNTMAQKLEEYNNSSLALLMLEKKRIEILINNMHDPVIGLDENFNIIFVNEKALKIVGLKLEDLIGKSAHEISVHNDLVRSLLQSMSNNENRSPKPIKIFADAKESYFEKEVIDISDIPTGEKNKKLFGHVIILRNVTQYKELDTAKTNFIATVSHEFKTPISSIKLGIQILENTEVGALNEEQRGLVEGIKEDADRLLKITGELLNMTQVESGNIQLTMKPVEVREILNYAITANKVVADQKNVKLDIIIPPELPKVLADNEKTAWVLTNLISNAIRYSYDNSSVVVNVSTSVDNILFSVKDTGQGIAPQYKEKIFDRYFRVPGTKKEGTGLGLAISKEFIEAQAGTISVETDFGAGSTFTVSLKKAG